MLLKPLPDGGIIAVDLEKVLVMATAPLYENLLAEGLKPFNLKEIGQCSAELPLSHTKQAYTIYQGSPVREVQ